MLSRAERTLAPRLDDPAVAREAGLALVERLQIYDPSAGVSSELAPLREKAFQLLERSLQAHPQDIEAASAYALLASQLNRELGPAAAMLGATRQLMPRSPDAAYAAAILAESRGDQARALSEILTVARFSRLQDQRHWVDQRLDKYRTMTK
jgi:hypothetical protein